MKILSILLFLLPISLFANDIDTSSVKYKCEKNEKYESNKIEFCDIYFNLKKIYFVKSIINITETTFLLIYDTDTIKYHIQEQKYQLIEDVPSTLYYVNDDMNHNLSILMLQEDILIIKPNEIVIIKNYGNK